MTDLPYLLMIPLPIALTVGCMLSEDVRKATREAGVPFLFGLSIASSLIGIMILISRL